MLFFWTQGWDWKSVLPYFKKSENYLGRLLAHYLIKKYSQYHHKYVSKQRNRTYQRPGEIYIYTLNEKEIIFDYFFLMWRKSPLLSFVLSFAELSGAAWIRKSGVLPVFSFVGFESRVLPVFCVILYHLTLLHIVLNIVCRLFNFDLINVLFAVEII